MTTLSRNAILFGSEADLPRTMTLRAGPLSLLFEAGDLRYVKLGEHEVLRRVYVAVRDRNWGTIPMRISDLQIEADDDRFTITYSAAHREREIDFHWDATIQGTAAGRISFSMQGEARSTFLRNRIGFCVLHPPECAGHSCRVVQDSGEVVEKPFPRLIAPAPKDDPFQEIRHMSCEVSKGAWADLHFEGDIFETEDQRNWSDGSFKTFCTPLRLPFPVEIKAGAKVSQRIELRLRAESSPTAAKSESEVQISIGTELSPLPNLGLCLSPIVHNERQVQRLKGLGLSHLRAELHLEATTTREDYLRAVDQASRLDIPLELAVYLPKAATSEADFETSLDGLSSWIRAQHRIARCLVFQEGQKTTPPATLAAARRVLGPQTPQAHFGGGSAAYFTELNRDRPDLKDADFLCYSVNPQVHAFDNTSLIENALAIAYTVESATALSFGRPIAVTPITLRSQFNPDATAAPADATPDERPSSVDPRQMSLFGGAWTLASIRALAEAGASSATYYETVGWRGVMERDEGSPAPDWFRSVAGGVFPLYHVFAAVGEFRGGEVVRCQCTHPLTVAALVLREKQRQRLLIGNLTPQQQIITIEGASGEYHEKRLDESNAVAAMEKPEEHIVARGDRRTLDPDGSRLTLEPYGLIWLDRA